MKQLKKNFHEYFRTPFPYLFLCLCLFLGTNMVRNPSFHSTLNNVGVKDVAPYELCWVCSDPNATDAMSDIGFTVSNFILFPVNAVAIVSAGFSAGSIPVSMAGAFYIASSGLFGLLMPFVFFLALSQFKSKESTRGALSIHAR